jgi:MarR family transcriptional regulator, organic hydroperoxide resistance regulator
VLHLHRQAMQRTMDERGGHHAEAFCMRVISRHEGTTQRDLAEILHLSRPQVTKTLQALERQGLIARTADENDQRLTRVFITDRGREEETRFRTYIDGYVSQTIGALPEQSRVELERTLNELAERITEALHAAPEIEK